ncbi:Phytochrome-like protein cph1 [Roseivivax sp. THAF40]|uniref:CHASE domain-containing protein n=1 Tax=unclassified Roseivivax TaxID=2639302 RepID=UPI0012A8EF4D|nr:MULTISPECIES: CHASE domain-containing protein [unclassified Roseivivax]QFS84597.1 Phytochrome-like protein cph1 [Roseivivax sp. THAF197b]QFT48424.1 Phytochrome-like protein cph1 [Roseivivax sp. THAF40]
MTHFSDTELKATQPLRGLRNIHYVVLVGSLVLTFLVWNFASHAADRQAATVFDNAVDQVLELITERMKSYEDGLRAGVGAINANGGDIGLTRWRTFAETLQIDQQYPGINGIGVIFHLPEDEKTDFLSEQRQLRPGFRIHPEHDRDINLPITYIEPEGPNAQAVGLDMAFEANRLEGLLAARDSGEPRITGPIVLVQDAEATPGFLFYAPFYAALSDGDITARREAFAGAVYAPFVMKKLMQGMLDRGKRPIWVSISDGETLLYDEHLEEEVGYDPDPVFTRTVEMDMYGRVWRVDMRTNLAFRDANLTTQPTIILICGLIIDALLLVLFWSLARSNHRAIAYSDQVTEELRREKRELINTNEALQQFSYVASHDLKTPIRGMRDTTDYLMEDLEERHPDALKDPDISRQFHELKELSHRMEALVKGVLDCAQIPRHAAPADPHNPRDIILDHAHDLRLSTDQLQIEGIFPDLFASATTLSQIFGNLLGNAVAHGVGPAPLRIKVTGNITGEGATFSVADNGPGIPPKFHEKIFEMFQSLGPNKTDNATGIGLAIVRKAAESVKGTVTVQSHPGQGAEFIVTFPSDLVATTSNIAAE